MKESQRQKELTSQYRGLSVIVSFFLLLFGIAPIFTYTLSKVLRFISFILFLALHGPLFWCDHWLRQSLKKEAQSEETRAIDRKHLWQKGIVAGILLLIILFVPGIPIAGYAIGTSCLYLLLWRIRLSAILAKKYNKVE